MKKTNISTKKTTTYTENIGKSKKGDVKGINVNTTNTNKLNLCEMKKNENVKKVTSFHETNKNTKMKRKEIDSAENTNAIYDNKVSTDCEISQFSHETNKKHKKQQILKVIIQNK